MKLEERFWKKVDKGTQPRSCWIWTGVRSTKGNYGWISRNGKLIKAHRVAWELTKGPIPEGLFVLHRCDNPPCVNPDHLFLGTLADNAKDRFLKGRGKGINRGEKNGMAKLTTQQVSDIKHSILPQGKLAEKYKVHESTISDILHEVTWKQVL